MNPRVGSTKERKTFSIRLGPEVIEEIDRVTESHRVSSKSEAVEWLIRHASGDLAVQEMLRKAWAGDIAKAYGADAVVSVRVNGGDQVVQGQRNYSASATVNGKEIETLSADAEEVEAGDLEVTIRNPLNDTFPLVVFDRLTAAQVNEARELSGWEGSDELSITFRREIGEVEALPILNAPGDRRPETRAEVVS